MLRHFSAHTIQTTLTAFKPAFKTTQWNTSKGFVTRIATNATAAVMQTTATVQYPQRHSSLSRAHPVQYRRGHYTNPILLLENKRKLSSKNNNLLRNKKRTSDYIYCLCIN